MGHHEEENYRSWNTGLAVSRAFAEDNTLVSAGVNVVLDWFDRYTIKGGFDAGVKFYDALQIFKRLVNIGDAKSLAAHPASTTHRQLTDEELKTAGVTPDMIRLCVGIEGIEDILADIDQALAKATS